MAQYFYGTDLYNDLFLNNNRELYIKMFLLESTEPEANSFYIKSSDVSGGIASNIIVPYGKYDYTELTTNLCPTTISGQSSPYNLIFANSSPSNSRGSFVYTPTITSGTFLIKSDVVIYPTDGRTGHFAQVIITYSDATTQTFYNYEADPDARLRSIAFLITSDPAKSISTITVYFLNYTGGTGTRTCQALNIELKQVSLNDYSKLTISDGDSISFNTIEVDVARGSTVSLGSTFLCGEYVYINLPITNFYTSSINLIYSRAQTGLLSLNGINGTAYELNKTHKLFFANKQIEGRVINGSLKADGNSPMRRSLDFSCIVDREFTTSSDLKLHDFDNKKIKVLIGIKDTAVGENGYDYYNSYSNNGMQKDLNEIVWFKLGTFIPQNISIKHGVESYSISITAQDKMSTLDGSFGGALGTGLEFKDPASGQNTNFYDTILDSITKFSTEKTENINIKFVDDFTVFKNPPTTGSFITAGSTVLYILDSSNLFPGMEIESPGIYSGTKVVDVGVGRVFMDYTAYQTIGPTDAIFADKTQLVLGVSFTSPSYKNNFGIEPLTNNNTESPTPVFFKKATIAFKGSTYTYGATGGIYTSIVNWSPTTWGSVLENQKKPYLNSVFSGEEVYLTGQAVGSSLYTSGNLKIGDYIATQESIGGLNAPLLDIYQYYIVTNVSTHDGSFTVDKINWNAASSPVTFTTEVKNENVLVQKFDFLYTSSITSYKAITSIAYNKTNSRFVVATDLGRIVNLISNYNSYSNNSSVLTYAYDWNNTEFIISNMAIGKDTMYIVDNVRNIISGHDLDGGPNIINITSQTIAGAPAITGSSFFYSSSTVTPVINQAVSIKNANGLELRNNAIYYIKRINTTNKSFSLINSETGLPVIVTSNITATVNAVCAPIMVGPFTDSILGSSVDKNQDLIICGLGTEITKYTLNKTTNKLVVSKQSFYERGYRLLDSDSNNNVYALSDTKNILTKLNSSLIRTLSTTIPEIWKMVDSKAVFNTYPLITSLSIDDNDNICLVTEGSYSSPTGTVNINKNLIILNSNDFSLISAVKVYDPNIDYSTATMGGNNIFYYGKDYEPSTGKYDTSYILVQNPLASPLIKSNVNSFKEFAPQSSNTIVKSGSDKISSVLEDVKSQLGSYQYYYDYEGAFNFKEDKRLSFFDPNYDKLSPYEFTFENYNINVGEVPFNFDFIKNNELVIDYNSSVDLSAFKNDFFLYGTKKGLDIAVDNTNIPMLYHIMIDDISLKNIPSTYQHPWQQYISDQGIAGTTYSNFIYFKEIKENFEFKDSRVYTAGTTYNYVQGEFILVNNTNSGISSSVSYSLYEVITGGTPSASQYPTKKDGTVEILNIDQTLPARFSVKYYGNVFGLDYKKYQGVYNKFFDSLNDNFIALRKGSYFTNFRTSSTGDLQFIFRVDSIYYYDSTTGKKIYFDDDRPIGINLYNDTLGLNYSNTFIGKVYSDSTGNPIQVLESAKAQLGGPLYCYLEVTNIDKYVSGFKGIFRKDNTGINSTDFNPIATSKNGDPTSWTYYYDIVNIIGQYIKDPSTGSDIAIAAADWEPSTQYNTNTFVFSDDKVYQALIGGESGTTAPSGLGDSDGLIRDFSGGTKLTWIVNQTLTNFNKFKVSKIGSRKSSIFDKDINVLFAPKEALNFFDQYGYYLVPIDDALYYETYSEAFHARLEGLIRQLSIKYPQIKIVFVPQSQINELFIINKLTQMKDAFSSLKRNFYLNFVQGQSISISAIPVYTMEPLGIIKISDDISDIYGNFLLTDYVLPLSNEGPMSMTAAKTHPYNDGRSYVPEVLTNYEQYGSLNLNTNTVLR